MQSLSVVCYLRKDLIRRLFVCKHVRLYGQLKMLDRAEFELFSLIYLNNY
jgi:hypothetical protein